MLIGIFLSLLHVDALRNSIARLKSLITSATSTTNLLLKYNCLAYWFVSDVILLLIKVSLP